MPSSWTIDKVLEFQPITLCQHGPTLRGRQRSVYRNTLNDAQCEPSFNETQQLIAFGVLILREFIYVKSIVNIEVKLFVNYQLKVIS